MGIDESGKGDFFGPLVIAGAYVDANLFDRMKEMNVRDSKMISSDDRALDLGRALRRLLGSRYSLIKIGPEAYNRLYAKMRNVNLILGWAHARAIENLLDAVPDCPRAISDQFGSREQVQRALMKKGRAIELVQRHKAESDMAVAAASVIAREIFLRSLAQMREEYKLSFPKGASPAVTAAAVELVRTHDPSVLLKTAKCHFKTTDVVLKEVNADRTVLAPEGRVTSRPPRPGRFSPKKRSPA
jgi:ribonuclease HIII